MKEREKWAIGTNEKNELISAMTSELTLLRTKAGISQGELANIIGVSRQTYGAIERGAQRLTWNTYLSLVLFYDYNAKTHDMIRSLGAFPKDMFGRMNQEETSVKVEVDSVVGSDMQAFIDQLDEQALNSLRTMVMIEYARCTGISGEAVVKSFDGVHFVKSKITEREIATNKSIREIKERQRNESK